MVFIMLTIGVRVKTTITNIKTINRSKKLNK